MNRGVIVRLLPLAVFVLLVVLFALPLFRGADPTVHPSALVGRPLPDFTLPPALDGQRGLATAALKGQVVLLNVFASWCVTCAAEQKFLVQKTKTLKIPLYGIDYKDKQEDVAAWLNKYGNPFTAIGADADGRAAIDLGVYGVPETYLIDKSGVILYRQAGPLTEEVWRDSFLPLLQGAAR